MIRRVSHVRFHESVYMAGVGELGSQLPNPHKNFVIEMVTNETGLHLSVKGNEILVPWANIKSVQLIPEPQKS